MYPYIYLIFYMDTYRNAWYNTGTVERVNSYSRHPHYETKEVVQMADAEKKVSAAQRKATDKYLEKFDEMRVRVPAGRKAVIKAHADAQGESLNSFIVRAMDQTMERDSSREGA